VKSERRTVGFVRKRKACELLGWEYEILTEPPSPLGDNIASLAGFRFPPPWQGEYEAAAIEAFSSPSPLGATCAALGPVVLTRPVVFHLCWKRVLAFDLDYALDDGTLVEVRS
jgi:hypothetical protein